MGTLIFSLFFIFVLLFLVVAPIILHERCLAPYRSKIDQMLASAFKKVDLEKKRYTPNEWKLIKEWKENMRDDAFNCTSGIISQKKCEENINHFKEILDRDVQNIQSTIARVKREKNLEEEMIYFNPSFPFFIITYLISICWLLLGGEQGIFYVTLSFGLILFPRHGLPRPITHFEPKSKLSHFLGFLTITTCGYFLNQWTYKQSDDIQMWVSLLLPVIYGIIYYMVRHKKKIKEL